MIASPRTGPHSWIALFLTASASACAVSTAAASILNRGLGLFCLRDSGREHLEQISGALARRLRRGEFDLRRLELRRSGEGGVVKARQPIQRQNRAIGARFALIGGLFWSRRLDPALFLAAGIQLDDRLFPSGRSRLRRRLRRVVSVV